jgi:hypothetical protein
MKALSLKEPWATLVASGKKTIETRKWRTNYRGPVLICACQPVGMALCIVELLDCRPMIDEDWPKACCDPYSPAFAWVLGKVTPIERFAVRGMQGLFPVPASAWKKLSALKVSAGTW